MAVSVVWGPELKADYQRLWDNCKITPGREKYAEEAVKMIVRGKARYEALAKQVGCPWWLIGLLHKMEASCDFGKHLHNGDPLTARTAKHPPGRPVAGNPPFTFEQSALDALINVRGFKKITDWSLPHILYICEGFNGYGYRMYHPQVKTPYLWSFTNQYTKGKYIEKLVNGKWVSEYKPELVSQQLGIAAIIKHGFLTKAFA